MKTKAYLKTAAAVLCFALLLCTLIACKKDKQKEGTETPTEATFAIENTDPAGTVEDNDAADDIGEEVVLPPVKF